MASYHGHSQSEPAKVEQIITEFFTKSLQIILESRAPYVSSRNYSGEQMMSSPSSSSSSSSSIKPRDKWFNLALRDCPGVRESTDFWRHSNLEPMVVDVILVKRPNSLDPVSNSPRRGLVRNASNDRFPSFWNADNDEFGFETKADKIIERWVVQYESRKTGRDSSSGTKRSSGTSSHILYKKSILLLRSLYAMIRLLPVYKLFRDLNSSSQVLTYNLSHRVSSFVEPFTRREESGMQRFEFTPVDTFCGRLCLSVLYRSSFSDVSSEPSTPITPQFIPDYVGSPLADRSKRFPSFSPFGRRHSWSYDLYAASPPSEFPSPSPTYSDSRVSVSKPSSHRLPPSSLPRYLPGTPPFKREHKTFDEFGPSPAFSPSTSPSPPASLHGNQIPTTLLRSESAPVSIPGFKVGGASSSNKGQILPPSPPFKGSRPSASRVERSSGLVQTNSIVDKFTFGKHETGRYSGVRISSCSSPQKSFSRSSSRLSLEDDFDDSEFSGPFIVDDDDLTDAGSRPGSFDQQAHIREPLEPGGFFQVKKSQDGAVSAHRLLKKAPPLRQDITNSIISSEEPGVQNAASLGVVSSGLVLPKTTADALEELRGYTELKDLLLKQNLT
ncbi:hypothetical protein RHGRI_022290 [Rhododendron griersonianum]|uniref:Autophagy-related protein 13 N-terminal domain-containing protein n=1 Tax=Rhododendron griersonianum TaxID=479676 RepID=A0AAV6J1F2_9ERIC|nr:hypothetical protein RHGRI_022290 [Rhododendron griersonianum]